MTVVKLVEFRSRESVELLESLLVEARAGELVGLAVCAKKATGNPQILLTDMYRREPGRALNTATRMILRLAQLQEDQEAAQA